jgi:hypothetical protein
MLQDKVRSDEALRALTQQLQTSQQELARLQSVRSQETRAVLVVCGALSSRIELLSGNMRGASEEGPDGNSFEDCADAEAGAEANGEVRDASAVDS